MITLGTHRQFHVCKAKGVCVCETEREIFWHLFSPMAVLCPLENWLWRIMGLCKAEAAGGGRNCSKCNLLPFACTERPAQTQGKKWIPPMNDLHTLMYDSIRFLLKLFCSLLTALISI